MSAVALIVKGTRTCNLRCTYCHDWAEGPGQTMSFEVLATLTRAVLTDPTHTQIDFDWHGGETTLLPIDWYRRAMFLQARFRRDDQVVQNLVQTNATRVTPEWARFWAANHFGVGVSIDGPPEVHDRTRLDAAGRPTYRRVMDGLALLRDHGLNPSVLMVVDEPTIRRGAPTLVDYLVAEGFDHVALIEAMPTNRPDAAPGTPTEHYTRPAVMAAFLAEVYDLLADRPDPKPRIRELMAVERRVLGERPGTCKLAGSCLGQYFLVEPDGEIAHCDLFLGDDRYTFGNIVDRSFADLRRTLALAELKAEERAAHERMSSCPEYGVCRGWCPHQRYLSARHDPDHRADCCGLAPLIDHVRRRLDERGLLERGVAVAAPARAGA